MTYQTNRRELGERVAALAAARFGGDYQAAFAHYDADGDGSIGKDELAAMLADAGAGDGLARWAWADGIATAVGACWDGDVSWAEFAYAVGATAD